MMDLRIEVKHEIVELILKMEFIGVEAKLMNDCEVMKNQEGRSQRKRHASKPCPCHRVGFPPQRITWQTPPCYKIGKFSKGVIDRRPVMVVYHIHGYYQK